MKTLGFLVLLLICVVWKGWNQPLRYLTMSQEAITQEQDQKLAAALAKIRPPATPTPTPRPTGQWMWEYRDSPFERGAGPRTR